MYVLVVGRRSFKLGDPLWSEDPQNRTTFFNNKIQQSYSMISYYLQYNNDECIESENC